MTREKKPTGLCDSNGDMIHIGDQIKFTVTGNEELHGEYCIYDVKKRGMVPIIVYNRSEKGQILPKGYTGSVLSDYYDHKELIFLKDYHGLKPCSSDFTIYKGDEPKRQIGFQCPAGVNA